MGEVIRARLLPTHVAEATQIGGSLAQKAYSPTVDLTQTEEGVTITVNDVNGEHTATVTNGQDYVMTEEDVNAIIEAIGQQQQQYDFDFDQEPTENSDNLVTSGTVYTALAAKADAADIPANVSELNNDAGYLTQHQDISGKADAADIPTKVSDLDNDSGFLTSFTETDPTVPSWAKAESKPTYTAQEVGALPSDTAIPNIAGSAEGSFAYGKNVTASGVASHAEGNWTNAKGANSHAEGFCTAARGTSSHAQGSNTTAYGSMSSAAGDGTVATHRSQNVFGENNVLDTSNEDAAYRGTYVEIVGNGSSINYLSNARALDWSGNEYLAGNVYVGCEDNSTGGTRLAKISEIPANVSDLNNDSGFLTSFTETDPTVPSWAKAVSKPSYTAQEVGALPDDTVIPSKVSDLDNDSGFITSASLPTKVSDLTDDSGHYTKPANGIPATDIADGVIPDVSGFYTKPSGGIPGTDLASGVIPDVSGKADKVTGGTSGNFASIDANGNLTDSGHKHGDYLTSHQSLANYVQKTDYGTSESAGVVKSGTAVTVSSQGTLTLHAATVDHIKAGTTTTYPLVPGRQGNAVFYGLAKAAGDATQSASDNAVGTYTDDAKAAIRTMLGVPAASAIPTKVSDLTDDSGHYTKPAGGIPSTDLASGVIPDVSGFYTKPSGGIPSTDIATGVIPDVSGFYTKPSGGIPSTDIASGVIPDVTGKADMVTGATSGNFAALDANGNLTDSGHKHADYASVTVETVSGTTPSITGEANHRYVCGEVTSLSATFPVSGIADVRFESGTTPTVLTVSSSIKWPEWFDPTNLSPSAVYELNVLDGIYGAVGVWT